MKKLTAKIFVLTACVILMLGLTSCYLSYGGSTDEEVSKDGAGLFISVGTNGCTVEGVDSLSPTAPILNELPEYEKIIIPSHYLGVPVTSVESLEYKGFTIAFGIGFYSTTNSYLKYLELPKTVKSVQLGDCPNLQSIKVDANNPYFKDIDGVLYTKDGTTLLKYPAGKSANTFAIPEGVKVISYEAFKDCINLESLVIPDGVTTIGSYAFAGCSSFESLVIPDSVTTIRGSAFKDCSSLESVVIPDGVTAIEGSTFAGCSSLESLVIPDSVTTIGDSAFKDCSSLESLVIPDGIISIGTAAFEGCPAMKCSEYGNCVYFGNESNPYLVLDRALEEQNDYEIHPDTKIIADSAFSKCIGLTSIVIPESVNTIGARAFENCSNLESVIIADGVKYVGLQAFDYCSKLTSIVIPESVIYMGEFVFFGCDNITIYCEVELVSVPEGWSPLFMVKTIDIFDGSAIMHKVVWGYKAEE